MAFKDIDLRLIDECTKDTVDFDILRSLIANGADINAFDSEYEEALYDSILDHHIYSFEEQNISNLFPVTELFLENKLILNPKPGDYDCFLPCRFRFLPPEKTCVETFKLMLEKGSFSFEDLDNLIYDASLDLHLGEFYFYEDTQYSKEDSLKYFLELIYWACAYQVKNIPPKTFSMIFCNLTGLTGTKTKWY